jgi:hypothetical protein
VGDLDSARAFALSLPGSTEEPHFDMSSFRVRGKIFATVPPDDEHLHVFVDEGEVQAAVAEDTAAFEPLLWGSGCGAGWISTPPPPTPGRRTLEES